MSAGTACRTPGDPFAGALLAWYDRHGRHDLPWKHPLSAYRVWVSEIMLQQTQVQAVVPYYRRFVQQFPDVRSLADAPLDAVLHLWSGLGYYARARNLHRAARTVCEQHGGELPAELDALMALPGIGRSTAGAILALVHGQRHPILDGNVKRVLSRYHAVEGWSGESRVSKALWLLAEQHTPPTRVADYTQAIMDLGATICTRSRPACLLCPLRAGCRAHEEGREGELPARRPRKTTPLRACVFVLVRSPDGALLLERRPPAGIWGGLWSFPECEAGDDIAQWCLRTLGVAPRAQRRLPQRRHGFTHFQLDIEPVLVEVDAIPPRLMEPERQLWYNGAHRAEVGLAAPVSALLDELAQADGENRCREP